MSARPALTPLAASLPASVPFVGPEAQERARGRDFRARLGANESGFGPSPKVKAKIREAADEVWKYADPEHHDLKASLTRHLGVGTRNIVIDGGIDGLLGLVVRLFVAEGQPVVTSLGAYPTFNYHVAGFGGRLVTVPYVNDKEDIDSLLSAVRKENAPLVYLANPDNPMGSWWEADEINRMIDALPETTLLVLDEAYCETAPASSVPALDVTRPNVIRMRTFSKAYGLAGMRVGYAIGEEGVIGSFDKVRNHFGMNRLAMTAAHAALEDQDYLHSVVSQVAEARERITRIAADNDLHALPSATNFVTIDCGADGAFAMKVMQALIARDVFVRKPMSPVQDRCIRVSVGPSSELDIFEAEFPAALKAAREG
jgi:histidinol-phosphate aminotransferase